ncbi:hypothetical protein LOD99_5636 [Oopsacas minuta]|uniref:Uncharacterized protein n=1 Tax=Oopsacas minuta TaxID=111878 RepID=A0AAV7JQD3_9METZ|nr:hypothetical protein LOD99_5636 [Oopsacas minuta]
MYSILCKWPEDRMSIIIISSETIPVPPQDSFTERSAQHIQIIALLVINYYPPIEIKYNTSYRERILAEPSIYSQTVSSCGRRQLSKRLRNSEKCKAHTPKTNR